MKRRTSFTLAVAVAGLAVPLMAPPAVAAQRVVTDPDDQLGADIRRVRIVNADANLWVRVRMDRIVMDGSSRTQSLNLYVDTDPRDPGPEYVFATGLNEGTDWSLRKVATWGSRGKAVKCPHDVRINWRTDRMRFIVDRTCLPGAGAVRVALKSAEWTPQDGTRVDWMGKRRQFSKPVPLG